MTPEEWEKYWAECEKNLAKIDAIYKWKIALIDRQRRIASSFLTGYVVLLFAGIIFSNYVVMLFGMLCALGVVAAVLWVTYQLAHNPYPPPGGKP